MADYKYLEMLSKKYRNIEEVSQEIINLQAILNLPKGTELFLSDIHGEYGSFSQIIKNGSGIIKDKIDKIYANSLPEKERKTLKSLSFLFYSNFYLLLFVYLYYNFFLNICIN